MTRHLEVRFAPGARLGSYEVVGPLGAGGMGEVYLGRDTRLDRDVALKVLPSRMSHDAGSIARFRREALALASLNHPNLATVHGFEESSDGSLVLVLERIEGVTLAERLSGGALQLEDALQICAQVAQALEVAHEHGIVHRDIKPGNIMIGPRGLVKVLDFGLARRAGAGPDAAAWPGGQAAEDGDTLAAGSFHGAASTTGSTVGTPGYMSPEQILAGEVDGRTDEFSLGCVMYECLTGRRAFGGTTAEQVMHATLEAEPGLSALPARLPERVRTVLAQSLAKSPAGRPGGMRAIRLEIERALGIRRASALRESGLAPVAHNLPTPTTSFVGREGTLSACGAALRHTRLLTLLGLGGSGKTRLALGLAETRLDAFPDGVWFVDLAPLADAARLDEALAEALEVPDEPGRTLLEGITRALAGRRALVILDNAETHLAACAALAGRLLGACPALELLVTAREPLGLAAETTFAVPSLAVPAPGARAAADVLATESALLFAERARAVLPDFTIDDGNAGAVAEICRRLDGIPLALELAAARVRMLGVEQIKSRLDDRFRLLQRGTGAGTDSGRQRTVRAVIQWSWDQLLAPEQGLMRGLAVFSGGWTLERATAVIAEHADEFDVLDLLTRLVERSLVVVERDAKGDARYRFLESVWRFAQEMLAADPERDAVRERHLACYLALAMRMQVDLSNEQLPAAIAELAQEEDNVLAALAWCEHAPDGARRALQLLTAIQRYWSIRGRYALGRRLFEHALARDAGSDPSVVRGWALVRLSGFLVTMGDFRAAGRVLEESRGVFRGVGETRAIPAVLASLGVVAMYEERYEDALELNEECRAAYEQNGRPRGVGMSLHNMGTIECMLGRNDYGRPRYEAALPLLRQAGDALTEALCLGALAQSLTRLGRLDEAAGRLRECLRLLEPLESPRESNYTLDATAELMVARGRMAEAARLLGAAHSSRLAIGSPYMPHERHDIDAVERRIVEALGPVAAGQAAAEGRGLTLDQGLAEAARFLEVSWNR